MKKKLFDEAVATTADWLISTNIKLVNAEEVEDYNQCAVIKAAIDNFLITTADIYQKFYLTTYTVDVILFELEKENSYIFNQIKEERQMHKD